MFVCYVIGAGIVIFLFYIVVYLLYSWIDRKDEEDQYQAALKDLQARMYFSICDPIILQSMMESLEYTISSYSYYHSGNTIKFLQVESIIKSESGWKYYLILCGKTKKENDELIKKYCEIKEVREERYRKAKRSNNDMSLHFLTSVQRKLDKVIEEEIKIQNNEIEKIKNIASRINADF